LLLNNAPRRDARPAILDRLAGDDFEIEAFWACGGEFPGEGEGYAGVYSSGSPHGAYEALPWIERQHRLLEDFAARGVPTLGVCFGSQILASALCGRDQVFRRPDCEVGYKWLDLRDDAVADPLCRGLAEGLRMFVWHNDEVRHDHPEMEILASTAACPNQVWRHRSAPAWGVQGHLEITRAEAPAWFERNRERLERDGADVDALIAEAEETTEAKSMLRNFLDLCRVSAGRGRDDRATARGAPGNHGVGTDNPAPAGGSRTELSGVSMQTIH
jgi:GMP synthase-like glutamine amidotransferase